MDETELSSYAGSVGESGASVGVSRSEESAEAESAESLSTCNGN